MTIRNLCSWALILASLSTSALARAEQVLSADQLNRLKIEQRRLITVRDQAVEDIVQNEKKIEVYMAFVDGKNPSALKDKALPAAGSAVAGTTTTLVLFRKYFPEFLTRLPTSMQRTLKFAPAVAGTLAAAWMASDYFDYNANVKTIKDLALNKKNTHALDDYYTALTSNRENLGEQIEVLSLTLDTLEQQLALYE